MRPAALDPRVARGMERQLAARRSRLAAGERPLGWKVGFGAPAALERFGLDRPLAGFLTDRSLVADGATVDVTGWARPALEPEVAVHLAADVPPDADRTRTREAIAGLSAAIELADVDPPPADVEEILAGNVFHRCVILGPVRRGRASADGVVARVRRDGERVASTDDPEALVGELVEVVRLTAELLGACGERLRAGEVVITGSVVPPLEVAAGERIEVDLGVLGGVSVRLAGQAFPGAGAAQ